MVIGKDSERLFATISKELKEELAKIAKDEGRSLSNLVKVICEEFVENKKKKQ